jgi:two-component system, LuxR family, sensor kinase FixL
MSDPTAIMSADDSAADARAQDASEDADRYRALFDRSMDAIYLSSEGGRIIRANPAFIRLFGYREDELHTISARDLYADPADRRRFQEAVATGAVQDFLTRLQRCDGEIRTCLITATVRRARDGTVEYQGIIRDVTARRREQAELVRITEELRRSNSDLEQFAYVASHDLQEPLRKIRAFGDRLATLLDDQLDERGADYLKRILAAGERMQALIQSLLVYSRLSSKPAEMEDVDMGAVVAVVLDDLEPRIAETAAEVVAGHLPTLQANPLQMRQLFQNLLSNALKYRAPDRTPRVEVSSELLDESGLVVEGDDLWRAVSARINVRDNGIGFESEYGERIFELFQRLHGRSDYDGAGIGLGICRRIAERHSGSIRAEGRPGQGATFFVTLPLIRERDSNASD